MVVEVPLKLLQVDAALLVVDKLAGPLRTGRSNALFRGAEVAMGWPGPWVDTEGRVANPLP